MSPIRRSKITFNSIKDGTFSHPSLINLPRKFPEFAPSSAGNYRKRSNLTESSIKNSIRFLADIGERFGNKIEILRSADFGTRLGIGTSSLNSSEFVEIFNKHKSDKSSSHTYQNIYLPVIADLHPLDSLLEIGIGTNNTKVISNMSKWGTPGASLRAFRELLPGVKIYGADIDKSILFSDAEIRTFFVNQLELQTFSEISELIEGPLDLIIDDGLHSPEANLNVIRFASGKLRKGGWVILEDINMAALPIFVVLFQLMKINWDCFIIEDQKNLVFAAKKKFA
jgi:hypothetical protein